LLAKIDIVNLTAAQKKEVKEELGAASDKELEDIIITAKTYVAAAAKNEAAFSLMIRNNFNSLPR
jgi:hypothetical protein